MARLISFALTKPQFLDGSKTVTRRMGWLSLKQGDVLCGVEKAMGLKPGEAVKRLGLLMVDDVRRERLDTVTPDECTREGFPNMTPAEFVVFFCASHKGCTPESIVTRIQFARLPASMGGK